MGESLECEIPIYHRPYFVFDPEDVIRNKAGVVQNLFTGVTGLSVTNKEGEVIQLTALDPATIYVKSSLIFYIYA